MLWGVWHYGAALNQLLTTSTGVTCLCKGCNKLNMPAWCNCFSSPSDRKALALCIRGCLPKWENVKTRIKMEPYYLPSIWSFWSIFCENGNNDIASNLVKIICRRSSQESADWGEQTITTITIAKGPLWMASCVVTTTMLESVRGPATSWPLAPWAPSITEITSYRIYSCFKRPSTWWQQNEKPKYDKCNWL